jgi:UPF0716 protein FxsA
MRLAVVLIFVAFPLLELALLIKAGETLGFWPTIGLLVAAAFLGFIVIRQQGLSMVGRMFATMNEGKLTFEPLLDGYVLIMAGFLLIMPGFLSDALALLLLVPPLRKWGIRRALAGLSGGSQATRPGKNERVIEVTYERLNEDDDDTPNKAP